MSDRQIIFLDFDGPLCTNATYAAWHALGHFNAGIVGEQEDHLLFCPKAVANLNWILANCPKAEVVLSTAWRELAPMETLCDILRRAGVERMPADRTPVYISRRMSEHNLREREIVEWLLANRDVETDNVLVIDDEPMSGALYDRAIRPLDGLRDGHVERALRLTEAWGA